MQDAVTAKADSAGNSTCREVLKCMDESKAPVATVRKSGVARFTQFQLEESQSNVEPAKGRGHLKSHPRPKRLAAARPWPLVAWFRLLLGGALVLGLGAYFAPFVTVPAILSFSVAQSKLLFAYALVVSWPGLCALGSAWLGAQPQGRRSVLVYGAKLLVFALCIAPIFAVALLAWAPAGPVVLSFWQLAAGMGFAQSLAAATVGVAGIACLMQLVGGLWSVLGGGCCLLRSRAQVFNRVFGQLFACLGTLGLAVWASGVVSSYLDLASATAVLTSGIALGAGVLLLACVLAFAASRLWGESVRDVLWEVTEREMCQDLGDSVKLNDLPAPLARPFEYSIAKKTTSEATGAEKPGSSYQIESSIL